MQDIKAINNIVVLGMVAACYAAHNPNASMRHIFSPPNVVLLGHDSFTANPDWKEVDGEKIQGVVLVKNINHYSAGPRSREVYFFPFSELDNMKVGIKGLRVE